MAVKLSKRLEAIVRTVEPGSVVVDVGTDHAHVPIRLLQDHIVPRALGFDVADGPLQIAQTNLELAGLEDACEVRKSDGLKAFEIGEADTLIIAGMGGILMKSILEEDMEKTKSFQTLILSPQSEPWLVRDFLATNDLGIVDEQFIEEEGKYYPILTVKPGKPTRRPDWSALANAAEGMDQAARERAHIHPEAAAAMMRDTSFQKLAEDEYGPCLLAKRDAVFLQFLKEQLRARIGIFQTVSKAAAEGKGSDNIAARMEELQSEIGMMQMILFMQEGLEA